MKYTKSLATLALIASAALTMSACSGTPGSSPTSPSVEPVAVETSTAPAKPEQKKSPRGNIIKEMGQPSSIVDMEADKTMVSFAVNAITVDAPCTGPYPQASENGHIVVLDVAIETTPELMPADGKGYSKFDMNASMFKFVGANGTTFNGDLGTIGAYSCLPDEQKVASGGVGPAEKVTGKIVLDVPATTGTLIFDSYLTTGTAGWEYNF